MSMITKYEHGGRGSQSVRRRILRTSIEDEDENMYENTNYDDDSRDDPNSNQKIAYDDEVGIKICGCRSRPDESYETLVSSTWRKLQLCRYLPPHRFEFCQNIYSMTVGPWKFWDGWTMDCGPERSVSVSS